MTAAGGVHGTLLCSTIGCGECGRCLSRHGRRRHRSAPWWGWVVLGVARV